MDSVPVRFSRVGYFRVRQISYGPKNHKMESGVALYKLAKYRHS